MVINNKVQFFTDILESGGMSIYIWGEDDTLIPDTIEVGWSSIDDASQKITSVIGHIFLEEGETKEQVLTELEEAYDIAFCSFNNI
ncbi:hypothetical protein ACIFOT_27365 [Neobacillus sp. NRS-1170]|uniref:hypothetical protein n=1 Tax=Neobacillus sp. NRS-1170 TaxID=3233898 RepID=UPI003D26AE78